MSLDASIETVSIPSREEGLPSSLLDDWQALAYSCGASFFQSPQWVEAWRRVYAPKADIRLLVERTSSGHLVGLLALARLSRPLHRYLPLSLPYWGIAGSGPGAADHLGAVASTSEVRKKLVSIASTRFPDASLMLENVRPEAIEALQGPTCVRRHLCPVADLTAVESIEELWPKKLRENLRRRRRRSTEDGYRIVWHRPGEGTPQLVERIGGLHIRRQRTLGRSGLFDRKRRAVLVWLAKASFRADDGLWIATLIDRENEIQAGLLGFQYAGAFYEYKTGWNPEISRLGPGKMLKTTSMRRAHEVGLRRYEFLRGAESYKLRLGGREQYDVSVLIPRGITGPLLWLREFGLRNSGKTV